VDKKQLAKAANICRELYEKYNHPQFIPPDPLQWVFKYDRPADREIVAFIASAMAYGRVEQINKSLARLFAIMGSRPADFVRKFGPRQRALFNNFKHRFNTGDDIADLIELLQFALKKAGSLENYFLLGFKDSDENVIPALTSFCESLLDEYAKRNPGKKGTGIGYLLTNPRAASACKRLNLFLRWMVRSDEVDPGVWKRVDKTKLLVPLDVHMGRLTKILGFHHRATLNLAASVEVTNAFRLFEPSDPVKYDFSLCRIGILEGCSGKFQSHCRECKLATYCKQARK
jgi:uncharacterized protein (TIGR02757 family)